MVSPFPRYDVHISGDLTDLFIQLQERATLVGRGAHVLAAMREIVRRVSERPFEFGEPLYRLPVMRIQVRQGVILPLCVDYGVSEDRPDVYIRGIIPMTDF